MQVINETRKAIAALLTALVIWGGTVVESADEQVSSGEWVALASLCVAAFLVWLIPNREPPVVE